MSSGVAAAREWPASGGQSTEVYFLRAGRNDREMLVYAPSLGAFHRATYCRQRGTLTSMGGPKGIDESVVPKHGRAAKARAATQIAPRIGDTPNHNGARILRLRTQCCAGVLRESKLIGQTGCQCQIHQRRRLFRQNRGDGRALFLSGGLLDGTLGTKRRERHWGAARQNGNHLSPGHGLFERSDVAGQRPNR
jgi:hypothetical protein